jgi:hypothetical protein
MPLKQPDRWVLKFPRSGCYVEVDSKGRLIGIVAHKDATRFASKAEAEYCLARIPFPPWFPRPYSYILEA